MDSAKTECQTQTPLSQMERIQLPSIPWSFVPRSGKRVTHLYSVEEESWEEKEGRKRRKRQGKRRKRSKREEGCNALECQVKGKTGKQFVITAYGMGKGNSS